MKRVECVRNWPLTNSVDIGKVGGNERGHDFPEGSKKGKIFGLKCCTQRTNSINVNLAGQDILSRNDD